MRTFAMIWSGQLVSLVGSGMTGFVLAVHVYRATGSTTSYTLIPLLSLLPAVVLSPWAGVLADRWDSRVTLIVSDLLAALAPCALAFAFHDGRPALGQIGAAVAFLSVCTAVQWPALSALTVRMVPSELGRASGMLELARALAQVFAPLVAGFVSTRWSVGSVLLFDAASYLFSALALLLVRVAPARPSTSSPDRRRSFGRESTVAWRYLCGQRGLMALLVYVALTTFTTGMVEICLTPLVLSFASPAALGVVLWVGGIGMLLGGAYMSVSGGPRRRVSAVVALTSAQGVVLVVAGMRRDVLLVATAAFAYLVCLPVIMASTQAIWLARVPAEMQGRVQGIRRTLDGSALPLAALVAGPLIDRLFEPWMASSGSLASTAGVLMGTGPGRGIALLCAVLGVVTVVVSLLALRNPRLRALDDLSSAADAADRPGPGAGASLAAAPRPGWE